MQDTAMRTLSRMSGSWNAQPDSTYKPSIDFLAKTQGAAPAGNFEAKTVLGGKFLQLRFQWALDGEQHESMGIVGLDTNTGRFVEFWASSNGTAQSLSTEKFEVDDAMIRMTFESRDGKLSQSIYTIMNETTLRHQVVVVSGDQKTVVKETNFSR
jgi:hypothetical protein